MSQTIRIPANLYHRLSLHAKGFDTPANVIERLLNFYEEQNDIESTENHEHVSQEATSLEIIYYPSDELSFKKALLQNKIAYVLLHKVDGTTELKEWNASKFSSHSDVNANLRSGYLRSWKTRGICKAEVSTNKDDLS